MRVWEEGRNEKRSKDKGIRSDPHVLASKPSLIRVDVVEFYFTLALVKVSSFSCKQTL